MVRSRRKEAGFTLIEVLVAFAVLGISAGVILSIFSSHPARIMRAENERRAVLAAKSLLAMAQSEQPLGVGTRQGELRDGIRWGLSIKPYGDPPPVEGEEAKPLKPVQLYLMTVRTAAGPEPNPATATVSTLYLAPSDAP